MHAKLVVELEEDAALVSTQLSGSLAGMVASLCTTASAQNQPIAR